jgi:fatty acid desaturase
MVRGSQKKQGDLQRSKRVERQPDQAGQKGSTTSRGVFWLHSLSFLLYNFLIGYLLLHRERPGLIPLILFASAMGFHFVVTDFGLRKDQKEMYTRLARWLLAGALVSGWLVGLFISISKVAVAILVAFLAGGVILNVMKEELPEERESRFFPFLLGAAGYAALLLLI